MPLDEFYIQTTGSNMNSGTTTSDTPTIDVPNGNWNSSTHVFIAPGGTPFASATVGDWAHVSLDNATTPARFAKIVSITGGGSTITLSSEDTMGTSPTTGTTGRRVRIGGAWADLGVTSAITGSNSTVGIRVNVRAGTYSNTTNDRTLARSGLTNAIMHWRGYNTTPGDCDTDYSLARPTLTFTTGRLLVSGAHQYVKNFVVTGAQISSSQLRISGANVTLRRVWVECTSANANGRAFGTTGTDCSIFNCYFKAAAQADVTELLPAGTQLHNCVFDSGNNGTSVGAATAVIIEGCIFRGQAADGVRITNNTRMSIISCTFHAQGDNGINITTLPSSLVISKCYFSSITGTAIRNGTANDTNLVRRSRCVFYNCGINESGFGDAPHFDARTDSSNPFVNAGAGNFALANTSSGYAPASPFEGLATTVSYADIGAVQHQDAGGGSTIIVVED
jgi:hypothetical protein